MLSSAEKISPPKWQTLFRAALIILISIIVYLPVFKAGYIWDDEVMLTENPFVQSANGLLGIWTGETIDYLPVTLTTLWLEWRMFEMNPAGYHIINVLLHALGAVLLWRVLLRLKIPGAWFAAILFAVHPVGVASVAWISERKNTLSLVFYLWSLLFYLRAEGSGIQVTGDKRQQQESGGRAFYVLSLVVFVFGLLSKSSIVILPVVLLLCSWWRRDKITRTDFLRTIPFFAAAFAVSVVTIWFQIHHSIDETIFAADPLLKRLLGGSWAVWFYLWKALVPVNLSMIYPRWGIDSASIISYLPGVAWFGLLFLLWRWRGKVGRGWFFGLVYFWVTLWPVLGFFDMSYFVYSQAADHWQYLSLVGITALLASGLVRLRQKWIPQRSVFLTRAGFVAGAAILCFPAALTWQRAKIFANAEALWRDTLKKNPKAWAACNNLSAALEELGKLEEADIYRAESLRLEPRSPDAQFNMAKHLASLGDTENAIAHYRAVLKIAPNYMKAHNNLGVLLAEQGKIDEAIEHYSEAVRIVPDYAVSRHNLSYMLLKKGKIDDALVHGLEALRLDPTLPEAHYNMANILFARGKLLEATEHFTTALRLRPDYAQAHYNFGLLFVQQQNLPVARQHFAAAVVAQPKFVDAWNNLANTFAIEGKWQEAADNYSAALRVDPDHVQALSGLGFSLLNLNRPEAESYLRKSIAINEALPEPHLHLGLALMRQKKVEEASAQFRRVTQLKPELPEPHYYLGMIFLGAGNEKEAVAHFHEAAKLKPDWFEPLNNIAWILATSHNDQIRNGVESVQIARRVVENNRDAASLDTLAAALAESKNFPMAIETAGQALKMAQESGDELLQKQIAARLEFYRIGKPFRE